MFGWNTLVVNLNDGVFERDASRHASANVRDLRRLEWIIGWKMNGEEEDTTLEWTVTRSHDRSLP